MKPPLPANEKRRLEVLWQYQILDTPPEAPFDDLAELAALVCDTPVALISLADEKRQWFKARVGITATETARDISFCAHAILQTEVLIVHDALRDPRFAGNPLVTGSPFIRFYAGAPLVTEDGLALGTICVIDRQPRDLTPSQVQALEILARLTLNQIKLRRQIQELSRVPIHRGANPGSHETDPNRPRTASGPGGSSGPPTPAA